MIKHTFSWVALAASAALMGLACSDAGQAELEADLAAAPPDSSLDLGDEEGGTPSEQCDPEDPQRRYVSTSPEECSRIRFACEAGTVYFGDACGCGCETPGLAAREIEPALGEEEGQEAGNLCGGRYCDEGEDCIGYYGVAGREGRMFHTCGIRCELGPDGGTCPAGKSCVNMADGPSVCQ